MSSEILADVAVTVDDSLVLGIKVVAAQKVLGHAG